MRPLRETHPRRSPGPAPLLEPTQPPDEFVNDPKLGGRSMSGAMNADSEFAFPLNGWVDAPAPYYEVDPLVANFGKRWMWQESQYINPETKALMTPRMDTQ